MRPGRPVFKDLDRREILLFVATWAYSGKSPVAPAAVASFTALLSVVLLRESWFLNGGFVFTVLTCVAVGFWVSGRAEVILGEKDAKCIVIDDVAGFLIAIYGFQQGRADSLLVLWVLFRVIDNVKVFPLRLIEARLTGASAIMLDDVVAGVYANVVARLVSTVSGWPVPGAGP